MLSVLAVDIDIDGAYHLHGHSADETYNEILAGLRFHIQVQCQN